MKQIKCPILKIYILLLVIGGVLIFEMANIMFGQFAKIQFLKQSNVEQQQEKEVYIEKYKKLEKMLVDSGQVVDNCECK